MLPEYHKVLDLKFTIQHPPHAACYNTGQPVADKEGPDIILSYNSANNDVVAKLKFLDVVTYRIGSPNDHGFYGEGEPGILNDSMYGVRSFPGLKFGEFYEVQGYDWSTGLRGKGCDTLQPLPVQTNDYRHFVFFMRDQTFECICKGWKPV
jgi:hypothetical protein